MAQDAAIATATAIAAEQATGSGDAPPEEVRLDDEIVLEPDRIVLPYMWQGDATVSARALAGIAPPLETIVPAGDFQITYIPADSGPQVRILPDAATPGEELQILWRVDTTAGQVPLNPGDVIAFTVSARVYAPGATPTLFIADDAGSSSVALDSLSWSDATVARAVSPGTTEVRIGVHWRDVPTGAWLELTNLGVVFGDREATLSPEDPAPLAIVEVPTPLPTSEPLPTMPPTPTPDAPATSAAVQAAQVPTATPLATATPEFIIVTSTPTPVDVFEEATRVAQATQWASLLGPATPTPENMATPTPTPEATPTVTPIVVTSTPTPANQATATQVALLATAIAFTTGTPTPLPADAVVATPTDTPTAVPRATNTPRPTNTPTPIFVLLENIPVSQPAATPQFPPELQGRILFLTDYRGNRNNPDAMVINPDGSSAGVMTSRTFYNRALARDRFSADMRYHVFSRREQGAANAGNWQIFFDDALYSSTGHQVTYFGAGVAWAATWSPVADRIALVSSVTGNDEIWITNLGEWNPTQLTFNDWEWDHHPSFSPDGSQIVFYSNRVTGRRQLWIMDADGSNQRQLTNFAFEAWNPVWVKYSDLPDPASE